MALSSEEKLKKLLWSDDKNKDVEAKAILQSASDTFNINWNNGDSKWGFLHRACCYDRSDMVAELLKYPNININMKTKRSKFITLERSITIIIS